jgi:hypothetical protein
LGKKKDLASSNKVLAEKEGLLQVVTSKYSKSMSKDPKTIEYGVVNIELATSKICGSVFNILRF